MNKAIQVNEEMLHKIISESVKKVLTEAPTINQVQDWHRQTGGWSNPNLGLRGQTTTPQTPRSTQNFGQRSQRQYPGSQTSYSGSNQQMSDRERYGGEVISTGKPFNYEYTSKLLHRAYEKLKELCDDNYVKSAWEVQQPLTGILPFITAAMSQLDAYFG